MSFESNEMSSSMIFQPILFIRELLRASGPQLVTILSALFWSICNCDLVIEPQQSHTEQQYLKCGSKMLKYSAFKEATGRNPVACFTNPKASNNLGKTILICSFQSRPLSTILRYALERPSMNSSSMYKNTW